MNDQINTRGAVDLDAVKLRKQQQEQAEAIAKQAEEERAFRELQATAQSWDRAMSRAFKGVVSRPKRHRLMVKTSQTELDLADAQS